MTPFFLQIRYVECWGCDVRNDFRFIMWFFKDKFGHLFDVSFIKFNDIAVISGAPELDDKLWNPEKTSLVEESENEYKVKESNNKNKQKCCSIQSYIYKYNNDT